MLSIFKKKLLQGLAYMDGTLIPIEEIPDEIFSTKMMGDGVGVISKGECVFAPIDGEVTLIAPTKHAIAIKGKHDIQLLIHIGLDSGQLPNDCFDVLIKEGDTVDAGTPLIYIKSSLRESQNPLYIPMVIVENPKECKITFMNSQDVVAKESVIFTYE